MATSSVSPISHATSAAAAQQAHRVEASRNHEARTDSNNTNRAAEVKTEAKPPQPTVNTSGQKIGTVVNTKA